MLLQKNSLESVDSEINIHKAFEIVTNIVEVSVKDRIKMAKEGYISKLINTMSELELFKELKEGSDVG